MTWTKLSDDFPDDCWTLSDQAFRLHTEGLVWSNRKLLDCRLPKADVRRFAKHPDAATELVAEGWWADEGADYLIRHHAMYQRPRDKVLRQQEVNKANRAKRGQETPAGREATPPAPPNDPSNDSLNDSYNERDRTGQDRTGTKDEQFLEENGDLINTATGEVVAPHPDACATPGCPNVRKGPSLLRDVCQDCHQRSKAVA